jgi:hypothetical protein
MGRIKKIHQFSFAPYHPGNFLRLHTGRRIDYHLYDFLRPWLYATLERLRMASESLKHPIARLPIQKNSPYESAGERCKWPDFFPVLVDRFRYGKRGRDTSRG